MTVLALAIPGINIAPATPAAPTAPAAPTPPRLLLRLVAERSARTSSAEGRVDLACGAMSGSVGVFNGHAHSLLARAHWPIYGPP